MISRDTARKLWSLVLPISCLNCGEESDWICQKCSRQIAFSRPELCFCGKYGPNGLCDKHSRFTDLDGLSSIFSYADPVARELIKSLKYKAQTDVISFLEWKLLKRSLQLLPKGEFTVTSIPVDKAKYNQRGFNQAEMIARALIEPVIEYEELLIKVKPTKSQTVLNKKQRQKNLRRAFRLKKGVTVPENIIIVDDVVTTGSTMREAAKTLRKSGAKRVWGFALSHG